MTRVELVIRQAENGVTLTKEYGDYIQVFVFNDMQSLAGFIAGGVVDFKIPEAITNVPR